MSAAGDRLREASLGSDVTCETTRGSEELWLPAVWRDDEVARWQDTYFLKGVPLYEGRPALQFTIDLKRPFYRLLDGLPAVPAQLCL